MLQHEQHAGRVVDAGVAGGGEEDAEDGGGGREGDEVVGLADGVAGDVFEAVQEGAVSGGGEGPVAQGEHVVAPGGAGDGWGGLLSVDAEGGAVEGVDADVVGGGRDDDVGVAEGDGWGLLVGGWGFGWGWVLTNYVFSSGELGTPV